MGMYHSVGIAYGFEIPNTTDIDDIDRALQDQPNTPDNVGYLVIGDRDKTLLVTRYERADENTVTALTADFFNRPEQAQWFVALRDVAVRLGYLDHPAPAWLVVHNYR